MDKLVRRKVVPEIERISEQKKQLWERFFGEALEVVTRPRVASSPEAIPATRRS